MDTFGNKLRQARLERSLSLHEVEAIIKIGSKYLGALEEENIQLLPGKAYALGFCKTYAEFLNIDVQPGISELKQLYLKAESQDNLIINQEEHKKQRIIIGFISLLCVGIISAILIFYIPSEEKSNTLVSDAENTNVSQTKEQIPVDTQPQAEPKPKQIPENIVIPKPKQVPANIVIPKPQTQFTGLKLQAVSDISWVLVIVDGKEIFKGMIYPGQMKTFSGKLVKIKLGNAGAIDITYNNTHIGYLGSMGQVISKTFPDNTGVIH